MHTRHRAPPPLVHTLKGLRRRDEPLHVSGGSGCVLRIDDGRRAVAAHRSARRRRRRRRAGRRGARSPSGSSAPLVSRAGPSGELIGKLPAAARAARQAAQTARRRCCHRGGAGEAPRKSMAAPTAATICPGRPVDAADLVGRRRDDLLFGEARSSCRRAAPCTRGSPARAGAQRR